MAKVPRTRIAGVIADRTLKSGSDKGFAKEVAAYLLAEQRVSGLDSIMRDVMDDWSKAGYLEVLAYSAHPLTEELKSEITARIKAVSPEAKQIVITEQHDDSVVGGVRLKLANRQLDLSVEAKLNQFKQLMESN
jgi:F0F1-type ATP synthase delta subunit